LGEVELISVNLSGEHSHFHVLEIVKNRKSGVILGINCKFFILKACIFIIFDILCYFASAIGIIRLVEDRFDDLGLLSFRQIIHYSIA
jgi:hypothetical protein